jgi:hypothetical protein
LLHIVSSYWRLFDPWNRLFGPILPRRHSCYSTFMQCQCWQELIWLLCPKDGLW